MPEVHGAKLQSSNQRIFGYSLQCVASEKRGELRLSCIHRFRHTHFLFIIFLMSALNWTHWLLNTHPFHYKCSCDPVVNSNLTCRFLTATIWTRRRKKSGPFYRPWQEGNVTVNWGEDPSSVIVFGMYSKSFIHRFTVLYRDLKLWGSDPSNWSPTSPTVAIIKPERRSREPGQSPPGQKSLFTDQSVTKNLDRPHAKVHQLWQ